MIKLSHLPGNTVFMLILLAILALGCAPAAAPSVLPITPVSELPHTQILPNLVVLEEGEIEVRRHGSNRPVRVGLGAEVRIGDILRVIEGEAWVICGNETGLEQGFYTVQPGNDYGVPCSSGRAPRPLPGVTALRGDANPEDSIPYFLSPRSGKIRDPRPVLRWQPLPDEVEYTVEIQGTDGLKRPPVLAQGSEIPYPDVWPALQAGGADYRVLVQAAGNLKDEIEGGSLGFSLLSESDEQQLNTRSEQIRQRSLSEPVQSLLLAHLYLNYGLRNEVVDLLLSIPGGEQIAAVQGLLGETYLHMRLFKEAERAYQLALAGTKQEGLLEDQAAAFLGLGYASCGLAETGAAHAHFEAAKDLYQQLEQVDQLKVVSRLLEESNQKCQP
jgi:hypothetical protein